MVKDLCRVEVLIGTTIAKLMMTSESHFPLLSRFPPFRFLTPAFPVKYLNINMDNLHTMEKLSLRFLLNNLPQMRQVNINLPLKITPKEVGVSTG